MKCLKVGCENKGELMGTLGISKLVYCQKHKSIYDKVFKNGGQNKGGQNEQRRV